jgi:NTE family protein
MATNLQTALVFHGGGAVGAYHLGAYRYLHLAGLQPSIVTGVSIGAITAALIVGARSGDPVGEMEAVWKEFTVGAPFLSSEAGRAISSVVNLGMYRPRFDLWSAPTWTALLSTDPLRSTLVRHVDFDRLNDSPIAFATSAIDVETGEIEQFRNRGGSYVSVDDIVASGSLPPGFPMTEIDGKSYWDGGLFDTTPLQSAVEMFTLGPEVRRRLILIAPLPCRGQVPTNFNEVAERMVELQFASRIRAEIQRLRTRNRLIEIIRDLEPGDQRRFAEAFPGARGLDTDTYIDEIIHIGSSDPRIVTAASDFSASAIRRRIEAGYQDARAVFAQFHATI